MRSEARYWEYFLIVEEGQAPFHERVHFWDHIGTSFGAFRLISYHIVNKAMSEAFRALARSGSLVVPISSRSFPAIRRRLPESKADGIIRILGDRHRILEKYSNRIQVSNDLPGPRKGWYCGTPATSSPFILITQDRGVAIEGSLISELHALVLARLRGENPERYLEGFLFERLTEALGGEDQRTIAFLCDWALMAPYKRWTHACPGESHPGWRLVLGLEYLRTNRGNLLDPSTSYGEFFDAMSEGLGFHNLDSMVELIPRYMEFALAGAANASDADRNLRFYQLVADKMEQAYRIRKETPEAFALADSHEELLKEHVPPVALKIGPRIELGRETGDWFLEYVANASLAHQAFTDSSDGIQCLFHHLEIDPELACGAFRRSPFNAEHCYRYPAPEGGAQWIDCPFVETLRAIGLAGLPSDGPDGPGDLPA